ncbi:hypothetical protein HM1_2584 [Heliomicrobium modesticaldum Ice1]|uniref:Transposase n=1 Tax=Heliobacterium modesticaldum (strain ATCC 51547 / Ice1) TaxID=498761 RepID=B0TB09_HELMI|nr:hypothetical protein [Heliomicrobium modesticaldum]ABZ85120.1 hypothetical protein HM1_2584 [Heliomicrobium modesticaldum Ice1]
MDRRHKKLLQLVFEAQFKKLFRAKRRLMPGVFLETMFLLRHGQLL